jgi:hypothetical protein
MISICPVRLLDSATSVTSQNLPMQYLSLTPNALSAGFDFD